MREDRKSRNWVFTVNNFASDYIACLKSRIDDCSSKPVFIRCQGEIGASGTPHIQGMAIFSTARKFTTVAKFLTGRQDVRGIWLAPMRGSGDEAYAYTSKEESRMPGTDHILEYGTLPRNVNRPGGRTDLEDVAEAVRNGGTLRTLYTEHLVPMLRYSNSITRAIAHFAPRRSTVPRVLWFFGPTGTGKSKLAHEMYPDAYRKSCVDGWWDCYDREEAVIIDDYRANAIGNFPSMLRLFDPYPLMLPVKGAFVQFDSPNIIITSPYHPEECWKNQTAENMDQMLRRITEIRYFPSPAYPDATAWRRHTVDNNIERELRNMTHNEVNSRYGRI